MKRLPFFLSICLLLAGYSSMATKRALFMAIDTYNPEGAQQTGSRHWSNLEGCVNDAEEVKALVATKFGFNDPRYITFIKNQECTRDRILAELNKLINESQKGDIVFIYYAGHGSQVYNSMSDEDDKMDETMVPADIWKGAKDIRDKELAQLFNKLIDKGVILTIVYDSCHSGSVGRGPIDKNKAKERKIDPDAEDAKDATRITIAPEQRGALILSAAQDNECASEQRDEKDTPHGAFTIAFCKTLQSLPANASVDDIFASIRAIMKYNGKTQEPVLAGDLSRVKGTLFGMDPATLPNKTMIAVINPESATNVKIQGGWALGLTTGCILENADHSIQIQITEVTDVTKSVAKVIKGDASKIKPGELYTVEKWVTAENALKVYIPGSNYSYTQIMAIAAEFNKLMEQYKDNWVTDPSAVSPTHTVFYNNGWYIGTPDGKVTALSANPTANEIKKYLTGDNIKLFISYPTYAGLKAEMQNRYKENTAVEMVENSANASYVLVGRYSDGKIQYSFILPGINTNDDNYTGTMPVRTDFIAIEQGKDNMSIDTLVDYSLRLAKVKNWLALASPSDGQSSFPFYLALRNATTKEIVTGGNLVEGEKYGLVLMVDRENMANWDGQKRYVYVFALNSDGSTVLYYPRTGSSVENKLPRLNDEDKVQDTLFLGSQPLFKVTLTKGVDTYVIITTDEPIPNPRILESKAVKTRDASRGSWVSQLANVGSNTRGELITPSNWSIQRISVRSVPKKS
jgi:hypothetical protein